MTQILTPAAARAHLRVGDELADEQLASYIATAETIVADFLGRPIVDAVKGWPDVETVPPNVIHAAKVVLTDLYENRATPLDEMDATLRRLVGRYMLVSFG
jgi:hypothetical protein